MSLEMLDQSDSLIISTRNSSPSEKVHFHMTCSDTRKLMNLRIKMKRNKIKLKGSFIPPAASSFHGRNMLGEIPVTHNHCLYTKLRSF